MKIEEILENKCLKLTLSGNSLKNFEITLPELIYQSYKKHRPEKLVVDTTSVDHILIREDLSNILGEKLASLFCNDDLEFEVFGNAEIFNDKVVKKAAENGLTIILKY